MTRALNDIADACKDNTNEDANHKVVHTHDKDNGQDCQVLKLMAFAKCIPKRLLRKINAQQEDEGADQTNGNIADHGRTCHPNSSSCTGEQDTCSPTITAIVDEHDTVGVNKIVLDAT